MVVTVVVVASTVVAVVVFVVAIHPSLGSFAVTVVSADANGVDFTTAAYDAVFFVAVAAGGFSQR